MPTRLLDVGSSDDNLRIYTCDGQPLKYVALSYCWGQRLHESTTTQNLMARLEGFNANLLPDTHRDAIRLVRGLGLRYVWIDALCIVQDDQADWESESALMGSVYQNAYMTIAAVAATSAAESFLKRREYARLTIEYKFENEDGESVKGTLFAHHPGPRLPSRAISESEWRTRAWTYQEEMLSTRILYCTPNTYYFECLGGDMGEEPAEVLARPMSRKRLPWRADFRAHESDSCSMVRTFDEWYDIMEGYSGRFLTVWQDVLPAVSGLAHIFSQHVNSKYIAGLWENDTTRGLLWRHHPAHAVQVQKQPYRAPSWSWAAAPGRVSWRLFYEFATHSSFHIETTHIKIAGKNDMGSVQYGKLVVRGQLISASALRQVVLDNDNGSSVSDNCDFDWARNNVTNPQFFWDYKAGWEGTEDLLEIQALPIGTRGVANIEHYFLSGLLLKPITSHVVGEELFERCGYFEIDGADYWHVFEKSPVQLLSIV